MTNLGCLKLHDNTFVISENINIFNVLCWGWGGVHNHLLEIEIRNYIFNKLKQLRNILFRVKEKRRFENCILWQYHIIKRIQ